MFNQTRGQGRRRLYGGVKVAYISLGLAVGKDTVGQNEVAFVPSFHGPVAAFQQNAFEVVRLLNLHIGIPVAFDDLPHGALLGLARANVTAGRGALAQTRARVVERVVVVFVAT